MATAAIGCETVISPVAAAPWWRRRDTYALAAIAAMHVTFAGRALWELNEGSWSIGGAGGVDQALAGAVVGQCFLLSIWAALGGLRTVVRWNIVGGVYMLGVASVAYWFRGEPDVSSQCLGIGLLGAIL